MPVLVVSNGYVSAVAVQMAQMRSFRARIRLWSGAEEVSRICETTVCRQLADKGGRERVRLCVFGWSGSLGHACFGGPCVGVSGVSARGRELVHMFRCSELWRALASWSGSFFQSVICCTVARCVSWSMSAEYSLFLD